MSAYYTPKEKLLRVVWGVIDAVLFRLSPSFLHGWRKFLLRAMGAKIGANVQVFPSARITYPWLLTIGDRSVISWGVRIYNLGPISIGNDTVISQYAHLCGGTHEYAGERFTLLRTGLTIGSNVWIG